MGIAKPKVDFKLYILIGIFLQQFQSKSSKELWNLAKINWALRGWAKLFLKVWSKLSWSKQDFWYIVGIWKVPFAFHSSKQVLKLPFIWHSISKHVFHMVDSFLKCFSHGNYVNELISSMNQINKLWFVRENRNNWIQTWFNKNTWWYKASKSKFYPITNKPKSIVVVFVQC
jgi:hypothetical protein